MSLRFRNHHHSTIWAMVEWLRPNCPDGGDWLKKGWWQIEPGQVAVVYSGDPRRVGRFWYCYAHSADGIEWRDRFPETVPIRAFEWCEHTADTSSRTILMDEFDLIDANSNHEHGFLRL